MARFRRPPQFTIGQLMAVIAVIAVVFALLPMGFAIALLIATSCYILVRRTRLPRESSLRPIGCLGALLGLLGGGIFGATRSSAVSDGLLVAAMTVGFGVTGAIVGGLAGHFVAFALYRSRQPDVELERMRGSDPDGPRRGKLLAECELVEQLMSHAEKDGDNEVFTKLDAYLAKLKQDLGL